MCHYLIWMTIKGITDDLYQIYFYDFPMGYCKSTNFGGYKIWRFSKQNDLVAIKIGVSPFMQCTINVRSRILARQILAKTPNSPNSPNIIARQNLLIYSISYILACIPFSKPRSPSNLIPTINNRFPLLIGILHMGKLTIVNELALSVIIIGLLVTQINCRNLLMVYLELLR